MADNIMQLDLINAITTGIKSIDGYGVVTNRMRFIKDWTQIFDIIASLHLQDNGVDKAHGWLATWGEFSNQRMGSTCDVDVTYIFRLFFLYPFGDAEIVDGERVISDNFFKDHIERVNNWFNANVALNMMNPDIPTQPDRRIINQGLQTVDIFRMMDYQSTRGKYTSHTAGFQLPVIVKHRW